MNIYYTMKRKIYNEYFRIHIMSDKNEINYYFNIQKVVEVTELQITLFFKNL